MKHINTLFLLLLISLNSLGQDTTSYKPLQEVDILKVEPSLSEKIGQICNVETDWGKLGLRGRVVNITEVKALPKGAFERMQFTFNRNGRIKTFQNDKIQKLYIYIPDNISMLKKETDMWNKTLHEYNYKDGKLTNAEYGEKGEILQYGNNSSLNISYYPEGQVKEVFFIDKSIPVTYSYDENGQLTGRYYSHSTGKTHVKVNTTIEYNDKNDIKQKFTSQIISGEQTDTIYAVESYSYKYDEKDNWTECTYVGDGQKIITRRVISYFNINDPIDKTKNKIYTIQEVTTPPEYAEGKEQLYLHIAQNMRYPVDAMKAQITGSVLIEFVISEVGNVSDFRVKRSIHPLLDEEALRVVESIPGNWIPAKIDDKNVNVYQQIPIAFRLKK